MVDGAITDEGIERLRARIGVPEPHPVPPHYSSPTSTPSATSPWPTATTTRSGANPTTAATTRWEGAIAPPPLVGGDTLIGEDEVTEVAPEHRDLMKGDPLRGRARLLLRQRPRVVGAAASATAGLAAQRARRRCSTSRASSPGGPCTSGPARCSASDDGTVLSGQYRLMIRTERDEGAASAKKYDAVELAPYTDEQIDEIEAQYAAESARGAEPRWWEDVNVGRRGRARWSRAR